MSLLCLPLELFHEILGWSIKMRGIRRGLRLRLVNKAFAREILATLPLFRVLDLYFRPVRVSGDVPVLQVATAYLERRVMSERQDGSPVLLRVRNVAAQLCRENVYGLDEQDYIKQLCPLVIDTCKVRLDKVWSADSGDCESEGFVYGKDLASDVYVAALYTKTWSVVTRWAESGNELAQRSLIFGDARCHAARFGSQEVIAAMMESRYEDDFQTLRSSFLNRTAEFGRMDMVCFVFNFKAMQRPWEFARKRSRPSYPYFNESHLATLHTPSKEIFQFVTEKRRLHCTTRTFGVKENTWFLIHCAKKGWVDMASQYLALGALVDGPESCLDNEEQRPLLVACRYGHENVVKTLLGYGASTTQPALETAVKYGHFAIVFLLLERGAELGRAMEEAVAKGYRTIVAALLNQRLDARVGLQELVGCALEHEDEVLTQLLLQHSGGLL